MQASIHAGPSGLVKPCLKESVRALADKTAIDIQHAANSSTFTVISDSEVMGDLLELEAMSLDDHDSYTMNYYAVLCQVVRNRLAGAK